jgi:hypothetical protein
MVMIDEAPAEVVPTLSKPGEGSRNRKSHKLRFTAVAIAAVLVASTGGWLAAQLVKGDSAPSYLGKAASTLANNMDCLQYKAAATHDESVYKYHDQGTCLLDSTMVTITTFDSVADGDAFFTLMRGLIPVLHPTWVGAAYAAGDGWGVADTTNLTPAAAEAAVRRLGTGAVHIIASAAK